MLETGSVPREDMGLGPPPSGFLPNIILASLENLDQRANVRAGIATPLEELQGLRKQEQSREVTC